MRYHKDIMVSLPSHFDQDKLDTCQPCFDESLAICTKLRPSNQSQSTQWWKTNSTTQMCESYFGPFEPYSQLGEARQHHDTVSKVTPSKGFKISFSHKHFGRNIHSFLQQECNNHLTSVPDVTFRVGETHSASATVDIHVPRIFG